MRDMGTVDIGSPRDSCGNSVHISMWLERSHAITICSNLDCNCGALHALLVLWLRLFNSLIRSLFPLGMHDWILALQ